MSKFELSDKQKEIVLFNKGALLVKASAGSGKTRVLTERICALAQTTRRRILAITFTNQASEEIKKRLAEIDEALLEKVFVGTFHSFCNYVLENHGVAIGYKELPEVFSDANDREKLIEKAIDETPALKQSFLEKDDKGRRIFKQRALEVVSKIKRNAILDNELETIVKDHNIILLYYKYRDIMASLNAIDYDDLLLLTYKLFISNSAIASLYRRNFEYVCIDEAQDMNKVQYMVLRSLTADENKNVMLVGDPNQSIYGFNDSSADFMNKDFVRDYNPKTILLTDNYRSTKAILEYANRIIPNSSSLGNIALMGFCKEYSFASAEAEAMGVINKIKELITKGEVKDIDGKLSYDRFAILARNKYVLLTIEALLYKERIPYYYKNTSKGFESVSSSGIAFHLALQVKSNPQDDFHLSQLKLLLGIRKKITCIDEIIKDTDIAPIFHEVISLVNRLNDDGSNFIKQINTLLGKIQNQDLIGDNEELLNAYTDFKEILKHWMIYAKKTSEKSLSAFRNAMALGQTSIDQVENGIALSTVHTMKGQEKDVVFLIGMDDLTFPDYRALKKGGYELEQEKNNLYVAITRARRYLYITYPTSRKMPWGDVNIRMRSSLLPQ